MTQGEVFVIYSKIGNVGEVYFIGGFWLLGLEIYLKENKF